MSADDDVLFDMHLCAARAVLTGFAIKAFHLTKPAAEDLVQETMARAIEHRAQYRAGTNIRAWLFTIMRNWFVSQKRRAWRETLSDDMETYRGVAKGNQLDHLDLADALEAFNKLAPLQQESLTLVALGYSYDDAAALAGCPVGTIKSRVARARHELKEACG